MKHFVSGKAYVVGDSIDTDQIIPAKNLVYSMSDETERRNYGRYAMSAVPPAEQGLPFGNIPLTPENAYKSEYAIVIAGSNFGCGSSREHAPFALREAGIEAVVAQSYARIFYRNCVDAGFLIPFETSDRLVDRIRTGDNIEIDVSLSRLRNMTLGTDYLLNPLGDVVEILRAGNVFEYARQKGLI